MNRPTCQHVLNVGPSRGERCKRAIYVDNKNKCCLHTARESLLEKVQTLTGIKCANETDPYNGEPCNREAVYLGYCLLCLSGH